MNSKTNNTAFSLHIAQLILDYNYQFLMIAYPPPVFHLTCTAHISNVNVVNFRLIFRR